MTDQNDINNIEYETAQEKNDFILVASLGLIPFQDGNQWCFLWGDNIQTGVCGFGDTVHRAVLDFNKNVYTQKIKGSKMTNNEKELMPYPLYCGWCGKKTKYDDYFHECGICKTCNKKFINSVKNTRPQPSADEYNSKLQHDLMKIAQPFMNLPRGKTITPDMALDAIREYLTQQTETPENVRCDDVKNTDACDGGQKMKDELKPLPKTNGISIVDDRLNAERNDRSFYVAVYCDAENASELYQWIDNAITINCQPTPEKKFNVAEAHKYLENIWDNLHGCNSCGWHSALYEHEVDDIDILKAFEKNNGILEFGCLSKDAEDSLSHRGMDVDLKPSQQDTRPTPDNSEALDAFRKIYHQVPSLNDGIEDLAEIVETTLTQTKESD